MSRRTMIGPGLQRVITALESHGCRRHGNDWTCPAHEDREPSLSVQQGARGAVLNCHAGCQTKDVVAALDLAMNQLFDDDGDTNQRGSDPPAGRGSKGAPKRTTRKPWLHPRPADEMYPYLDENAEIVSLVLRYSKTPRFRQCRPDGDGWVWNLKDTRRVLFDLPRVVQAVREGVEVWITEGEKDAITLWRADVIATTNAEGASAWRESHTESLVGARVVIWRDNDEAGRAGGDKIVRSLRGKAAEIRRVEAAAGKDATDHFAAGLGLADVVEVPLLSLFDADAESDPLPEPTETEDGAALLDDVSAFLGRFVAYPSEWGHVAHTLWIAHCHAMGAWDSTPRIAFLSPERGCGKTRALEATEPLVPRAVLAVNATPAYLFRKVSSADGLPTILYDEIDTVFGPKAKEHEDVRAMLNAGHRKGAVAGRCVVRGKEILTEELPAYCPVALAGIGVLPDTILSRSVAIKMRRRASDEHVEPFRPREQEAAGRALRDRLAAWTRGQRSALEQARPAMPDGVTDRDADVWEALFAVADVAGGAWPVAARESAVQAVEASHDEVPSVGILLLHDIREVWHASDPTVVTSELLRRLRDQEESPWDDLAGKSLTAARLALMLRNYGVQPRRWRAGSKILRGYHRSDFADAWGRYLPTTEPEQEALGL